MPSGVEIVGADALASDGHRLCARGSTLEKSLEAAGMTAAQPVVAAVQSAVPRESGDMAGSVVARKAEDSAGYATVEVGYADLVYAGPVDFGGYPEGRDYASEGRYLFPAAEALNTSAVGAYNDGTQRGIDGFHWTYEGGAA